MEITTVNGNDFAGSEATEAEIDRLHSLGQDAEVRHADGAAWLFKANGRCIKLNDM